MLGDIQKKLKAPKTKPGHNYKYRKVEDILQPLKPILAEYGASIVMTDEILKKGDRFYIKATASLFNNEGVCVNSADGFAREPETKNRTDESQITGGASTYARKTALAGLFALDDSSPDPDEQEQEPAISEDQVKELLSIIRGKTYAEECKKKICKSYDVDRIEDIAASKFSEVKKRLDDYCKKTDEKHGGGS